MAKGIITTEFTIWCNRCERWEQEATVVGKAEMIRMKRAAGWEYKRDLKWYCPECSAELKKVKRHAH